ncbi:hypothetical protein SMICM17S_06743 [Streptomyces microflavus]
MTARTADRTRYDRATAHLDGPIAIVDLDAFDANADALVARAGGKPIRVASKSVRCRTLLERVLQRPGFAGIMSYTLAESLWLARAGARDVLLAYPSADRGGFAELAAEPKLAAAVTVMVDDHSQLELIDASRAGGQEEIRVCLELDTSLRLLGGRVRIGALRSPLRSPAQLAELARSVARRPGRSRRRPQRVRSGYPARLRGGGHRVPAGAGEQVAGRSGRAVARRPDGPELAAQPYTGDRDLDQAAGRQLLAEGQFAQDAGSGAALGRTLHGGRGGEFQQGLGEAAVDGEGRVQDLPGAGTALAQDQRGGGQFTGEQRGAATGPRVAGGDHDDEAVVGDDGCRPGPPVSTGPRRSPDRPRR